MSAHIRFWLAILTGITLTSVNVSPNDPTSCQAADKWSLSADPSPVTPNWQVTSGQVIEAANGLSSSANDFLRPATLAPILLTGNGSGSTRRVVWDLSNFSQLGTIDGRIDTVSGTCAISPDGKHFVVTKKKSFTSIGAEIWSVAENKKQKTLDLCPTAETVVWSGFLSESQLLTIHEAVPGQVSFRITSLTADPKAPPAAAFPGPRNVDKRCFSVSPGGRFLAATTKENAILITDLKTKSAPTRLVPPNSTGLIKGLSFSPDGTELSAIFVQQGAGRQELNLIEIVAWSLADGQLSFEMKDFQIEGSNDFANPTGPLIALEWLPDGSAILIGNQTLVDRNTSLVGWRLKQSTSARLRGPKVFLGTDLLLIPKQQGVSPGYEAFKLPWREIDAGLKALQSKDAAWLRPGEKLSLDVQVNDVRFQTPDQVKIALESTLQKRLATDQFALASGQAVTLKVTYSEALGGLLEKRDDSFPFPPGFPRPPRFPTRRGLFDGPSLRGMANEARRMANEDSRTGTGTAFIVHSDGYLLTCAHVVGAAPSVQVKLGEKSYHARVLAKNVGLDFALLKIEVKGLVPLALADSTKIELGEEVRAVGYPISTLLGESLKTTRGTIAGLVKKENKTLFQVDASINPGNSGGPLVNERGEVIGINSAKLVHESIDNVGFSIPINEVKAMLKEQKVDFQSKGAAERLSGPELVKKVTPSVAFVISTGGVDHGDLSGPEKVAITRIECELSLVVKDQAMPVWRDKLVIEPDSLRVRGALTEQKVRDIAFETLVERLSQVSLPYFVSRDTPPIVLPVVSDLSGAEQLPVPVNGFRKTNRGFSN